METPLQVRLMGLRKTLDTRSADSGIGKAELIRLAVHELFKKHKTAGALYQAQAKFLAKAGK